MKILETPSNITGHRYRHDKFVIWISEKYGVSVARLWHRAISPDATAMWYPMRNLLQERFMRLYEDYCLESNIDHSDVIYDNLDNTEAADALTANYLKDTNNKYKRWDVIEDSGEAESNAPKIDAESKNQHTPDSSSNKETVSTFMSYEEIMRQLGEVSASPDC